MATLGRPFWLAKTVPTGFEAASTEHGVAPLALTDARTQADMVTLMGDRDGTVGVWAGTTGCWVLGVGCWVLGVGCWVSGVGC